MLGTHVLQFRASLDYNQAEVVENGKILRIGRITFGRKKLT